MGFASIVKLPRCVKTEFYSGMNEMLWKKEKYARLKWGDGELRYLARKPTKAQ